MEGNTLIVLNRQMDIDIDIEHVTRENLLESWKGEFLQFFFVKNCYELRRGRRESVLSGNGLI